MPRFFFHLHNDEYCFDEEGAELLDLAAAEKHARANAIHMAAASVTEHQHLFGSHRIDVADEAGVVVLSVHFREVVKIEP